MKIDSSTAGNTLIVYLFGDIDHHNTELIKKYIHECIAPDIKNLVISLENVEFMDSSGIGMVLGRYKEMKEKMGTVALVGVKGNMERIYTLSGLYRIINNYSTTDEALKSIQDGVHNE